MTLFDDSPELRNRWSLSSGLRYEALLKQLKAEFSRPDRHQPTSPPNPTNRPKRVPSIRQPQPSRSGRFRYKVG